MHLRYVVWAWEAMLANLADHDPGLSQLVATACRPLAVDQRRTGILDVILGVAPEDARRTLSQPDETEVVAAALGQALDIKADLLIVDWPGRAPARDGDMPAIVSPQAPAWVKNEAAKCETPLQRLLLAGAAKRGIRLQAQYALSTVRVDLAEVRRRFAIDIFGWYRRRQPFHERGHKLAETGWTGISFAGEDVYHEFDACLDILKQELGRRRT